MTMFAFETNGLSDDVVRRGLLVLLSAYTPQPPQYCLLTFFLKGVPQMGDIVVHDDETTLHSTAFAADAEGVPTTFPTPPTYESSDESVAVVHASDDGTTATYEIGTVGDAVITVHTGATDADGNEIVGKGTIHVTPGNVAVVGIDFAVDETPPVA
jgi:hypothetical protein